MDLDAFGLRFVGLECVRRHVRAVAPIDDHRFRGAEPACHPGRVHGGVASAIDRHAAKLRRLVALDVAQETDRVEHLAGIARRDLGTLGQVRADCDEAGIKPALLHLRLDVLDLVVKRDPDAQVLDLPDLGLEHVARHPIGGNAEVHHAAGQRSGIPDLDLMTEACQVIAGGQTRGPGADHEHALARLLVRRLEPPPLLNRAIAEEALDGMDADRAVQLLAVAGALAGVIADPAVHSGHGVVRDQGPPGPLETPGLSLGEPRLDVLAGRAGMVARREQVDVDRALRAQRSSAPFVVQIRPPRHVNRSVRHVGLPGAFGPERMTMVAIAQAQEKANCLHGIAVREKDSTIQRLHSNGAPAAPQVLTITSRAIYPLSG